MADVVAKLEARIKSLEEENQRIKTTDTSAEDTAALIAASPKTKTTLEQEEAEIHKGMDKMMANNTPWPIPSVASETAWANDVRQRFQGMKKKAGTKPPEIEAFTGLLELEGDLVSFISAIVFSAF